MPPTHKACPMCGVIKPSAAFYLLHNRRSDTGATYERLSPYCRPCTAARARVWQQTNPERYRESKVRYRQSPAGSAKEAVSRAERRCRTYGMTRSEYTERLLAQGGHCLICRRPPEKRPLAVDHDHKTGAIRGLLCDRCNAGLGMFGDDPTLLAEAV